MQIYFITDSGKQQLLFFINNGKNNTCSFGNYQKQSTDNRYL